MKIKTKHASALRYLCYNNRKNWEIKKEISNTLKEKNCVINGKPIPVTMMPVLLSNMELKKIASVVEKFGEIIDKTVSAGFASPRIKDYLSTETIPKEWIQNNNAPAVLKRVDFIFNNRECKVIGAECDVPRGQSWTDIVRRIFANHPFYQKLITYPEKENGMYLLSSLSKLVQEIHKEEESPTIALVDFKDSQCIADLQIACRFLIQESLKAFIADPRDFEYRGGKAYINGARVDIVIRGCNIKSLLKHNDSEINGFIQGYINNAFVMLNPLHSTYGSEKSILSLIKNTDFTDIYTKNELHFANKHVPWTRRFSEQETFYGKNQIQLNEFCKKYRENLVIKPSNQNPHMVQVGAGLEQARWDGIVNNYAGRKDWVVQEYVPLPYIYQPILVKGKVFCRKHFFSFSAFLLNNKFQMLLARCSSELAININNGYVIPVFHYDSEKTNSKARKYLC